MSKEFHPDDAFLRGDRKAGRDQIDAVLEKHGLSLENIVTSRDRGWAEARADLYRENMPPGWETWQLPLYLVSGTAFFFLTASAPGAVLTSHAHDVAQLRIVLSGALIYDRIELKSGDWIYTPPKKEYSLTASLNPGGAIHLYAY